jgi:hypothetical protein
MKFGPEIPRCAVCDSKLKHPGDADGHRTWHAAEERLGQRIVPHFWMKPIPVRDMDWCATLSEYDGAPDAGWQPMGHGATALDAVSDLLMQIDAVADLLQLDKE